MQNGECNLVRFLIHVFSISRHDLHVTVRLLVLFDSVFDLSRFRICVYVYVYRLRFVKFHFCGLGL